MGGEVSDDHQERIGAQPGNGRADEGKLEIESKNKRREMMQRYSVNNKARRCEGVREEREVIRKINVTQKDEERVSYTKAVGTRDSVRVERGEGFKYECDEVIIEVKREEC